MSNSNENSNSDKKFLGLLAQFEDPASLVEACDRARRAGYKKMDAYSPFPVHGIDPAIGINRTALPFLVLAVGLGACLVGLALQYYTNNDISALGFFPGYEFKISGKPYFSLPANIPVTFEIIVLSSAFATFFGMWIINGLPRLANPLHRISRFKRVTNDKFFLMIEERDPGFDRAETEQELKDWGASFIEAVAEDQTDHQLPSWVQTAGLVIAFLCLLPPVIIFRMAGMTNRQPRMHVVPDMDWQHKNKTQTVSPNFNAVGEPNYLFADGRAMRAPIPGTIARGRLFTDVEYHQGVQEGSVDLAVVSTASQFTATGAKSAQDSDDSQPTSEPAWITQFPEKVTVDAEFIARGKTKFEIYCSVCHGYAGNGDGLVNRRAIALAASGKAQWTAAKSLHEADVKDNDKNPVGRIFDTISNGRSSMGPYKDQISVEDRWAIVAYVKALQATGIQPEGIATGDQAPAATEDGKAAEPAVAEETKP